MESKKPWTKVLHLVGGVGNEGGVMSYVSCIVNEDLPGIESFVWKHREFIENPSDRYVCGGKARSIDQSVARDILSALREVGPLLSWLRREQRVILHAHSRVGIFAGFIVSLITGTRLLIHLHGLAGRPWLYRMLWRMSGARPVFNSKRTCQHYGCEPSHSVIVVPPMVWPGSTVGGHDRPIRFVACGAFVRGKHFDILLKAFEHVRMGQSTAELHIYGVSSRPLDPVCQAEILRLANQNPAVHLHNWNPHWADHLKATDIFVHLGMPESFGIVILESFSRGCRLVVLDQTFLNDLPPPINGEGIYRIKELAVSSVATQMTNAMLERLESLRLWELRRVASPLFSVDQTRMRLAQIYESLAINKN